MRLLRLDRQHVARRNEPDAQLIADVVQVRVRALQRLAYDIQGRARRRHGQERTGDFELQIGARGLAILPGRFDLCPGSTGERLQAAARVDGPLQIDPRLHAVREVGVKHPEPAARVGHAELVDVIDARVARDRCELRALGGLALVFDRSRGILPCAELLEAMARFDASRDGLVQRQAQRRRLRERDIGAAEQKQKNGQ